MDLISIILIAFALAMDCFAVSIISGMSIKQLKVSSGLKIAVSFGGFQALMLLFGWSAGLGAKDFVSGVSHWIAFALLSVIGLKMIYGSIKPRSGDKEVDPLNVYVLLILSIATSIDALVVGVSFAFLEISIVFSAILIGTIAFSLSFLGVFIGDKFGNIFGRKTEIVGGLILIGIGIKILVEHLF